MRNPKAKTLGLAAVIMTLGIAMPAVMAFPDDKPKQEGGDLAAILEKLPPDVRDRLIKEIDRVRVEAERLKAEAMERGEQLRIEAAKRIEDVKRDAQERLERVEVELRRKAESAERTAREQLDKARDQAEAARVKAREADESARREARPEGRDRRSGAEGDRDRAESRQMRVEVRSENGEENAVVRIFQDGKEIKPDGNSAMVFEAMPKVGLMPGVDLEKLPPEKRAEFEKARDELKLAQEKLRIAMEKMAKLQGGKQENVMIYRFEGKEPVMIRPPMGDRLPGLPLPPGPAGRADRLPRQSIMPNPPIQPPAPPELERRISKAEKALDDILIELKKLQKNREEEDDDDDEEENKDKGGRKAKKS